ncbi:MAG: hypothetical protein WBD31_20625 [Rubripirellula sp.]
MSVAFAGTMMIGVSVFTSVTWYFQSQQSSQAMVANDFLDDLRSAQSQFFDQHGEFATSVDQLDLSRPIPPYFACGSITVDTPTQWTLPLTQVGSFFGQGTRSIVFTGKRHHEN